MYHLYRDPNENDLASNEHTKNHFSTLEEQAKKLEIELKEVKAQEQVGNKIAHEGHSYWRLHVNVKHYLPAPEGTEC